MVLGHTVHARVLRVCVSAQLLDELLARRDDEASRVRRSRLDTASYPWKCLATGVDTAAFLNEVLVGGDPRLTTLMAEHMRGMPAAIAMAQRAYLASLLGVDGEP